MTAKSFVKLTAGPFVLVVVFVLGGYWWSREPDGPAGSTAAAAANTLGKPGPSRPRSPAPVDPVSRARPEAPAPVNPVAGALGRWSEKSPFRDWAGRYLAAASEQRRAQKLKN